MSSQGVDPTRMLGLVFERAGFIDALESIGAELSSSQVEIEAIADVGLPSGVGANRRTRLARWTPNNGADLDKDAVTWLLNQPFGRIPVADAHGNATDILITACAEPLSIGIVDPASEKGSSMRPVSSNGRESAPPNPIEPVPASPGPDSRGQFTMIRAVLLDLGVMRFTLTAWIPASENAAAIVRRLSTVRALSVFRQALAARIYIDQLIAVIGGMTTAFDHFPYGVIHVEPGGSFFANTLGRRLIAGGDAIGVGRDGLFARNQTDNRALKAAIDRARGVCGQKPTETLLTLQRAGGQMQLNALVSPAFVWTSGGWVPSGRIIIFVADPSQACAPGLGERLRAIFSLTRSEARIVEALIGGMRLDEVADLMGNSVETVRAHLRHIFDKVGVHRQSDLIRVTMASVSMLYHNKDSKNTYNTIKN